MLRERRYLRSFVLLLAIAATLLVSTVAASPAHFHKNDFGGSCDICSIAHLPVVQPASTVHIATPGLSRVGVAIFSESSPADPFAHHESSRGPPRASALLEQ